MVWYQEASQQSSRETVFFRKKNKYKLTLPEFETFKMELKFSFPTNFTHCIIYASLSLYYDYCHYYCDTCTPTPAFECMHSCVYNVGRFWHREIGFINRHSYTLSVHVYSISQLQNLSIVSTSSRILDGWKMNTCIFLGNLSLPGSTQTASGPKYCIAEYG